MTSDIKILFLNQTTANYFFPLIRLMFFIFCFIFAVELRCCVAASWHQTSTSASWTGRCGMGSVTMNSSTICFVGGSTPEGISFDDAWCSKDEGKSWVRKTVHFPGGARSNMGMSVSKNEAILLGGAGEQDFNDVWATQDFESWTLRNSQAPWKGRGSLSSVSIKDKILMIGGINYHNATWQHFSDVWLSNDRGKSWVNTISMAPWHARGGHSVTALDNGLLVLTGGAFFLGEDHEEQLFSDVWISSDLGATWTITNEDAPWGPRGYHRVVANGTNVILVGGFNGSYVNDVWMSSDYGRSWVLVDANAPWSGRENLGVQVVGESSRSLVLFGGTDWNIHTFNDAWTKNLD